MKNSTFIKRTVSLLLALGLLFVFAACGNGGDAPSTAGTEPSSEAETSGEKEEAFVKPENYATVLMVTINPQFRLYLDADGIVLAIESVNKDAEKVKDDLSFEKDNYESVIEKIVTKAEEKGYIKSDAVINVEITETKDPTVNIIDILDKITITVHQTATKLELTVEIKTEDKSTAESQPEETTAPTEEATTVPTEQLKTEPTEGPGTVPMQCSHTYKDATCTTPKICTKCGATGGSAAGHIWKDATCAAPKTCTKCGATEGNAVGHNWNDATCTAPKTCAVCNATEGKAAGHSYKDATCTAPKTCAKCGATEGNAVGHNWSDATCTAPKTCAICNATEGKAAGHSYKDATCTTPKACTGCSETVGEKLPHNYQNGLCTSCGYRQLGVGTWRAMVLNDKYSLRVDLEFDLSQASKGQLIDLETAKEVCPEGAPKITYNGVTYVHWFFEGCMCFYECTEDTVTVYMGTSVKKENWPDVFVLKRISATEIAVTEAFGESQTYFGLQPGCVFTYFSS